MTNTNLINTTVDIIAKLNESNYIYETNATIRARVTDWYNHTDITDSELLAAAALIGDFNPVITMNDIEASRDFYFPTVPFEYTEIHSYEIEEALRDTLWR